MSHPVSRHSSRAVTIANSAEVFEVIREERTSPTPSSINMNATPATQEEEKEDTMPAIICPCKAIKDAEQEKKNTEEIEKLLKEKELELEEKFQERIAHEMQYLKDRFEFILQNEQIRASHMLREAHREREEKISALQTQLECKNMAGLMYVLCAERHKSKMEILRLSEEYTNYIQALQAILAESQTLILNLSRGYKTAAKVDHEWREKMKKIIMHYDHYSPLTSHCWAQASTLIGERELELRPTTLLQCGLAGFNDYYHFQNFVNNFTGAPPESNQYLFELQNLLKIKAPVKDDPCEDPCQSEDEESTLNESEEADGTWWNTLEGDDRPFVMFGDMADFKPPQRRQVLRAVKAQKTAPRKWKEYVFHDMFVKANCPNTNAIKEEYFRRVPPPSPAEKWDMNAQTGSDTSRRVTTASVDIRGHMGSILKIITSPQARPPTQKSTLLGARDSMEIASSTRLREKHRHTTEHGKVVLNIGNKIDSMFTEMREGLEEEQAEEKKPEIEPRNTTAKDEEDRADESVSVLGSVHHDSLQVINQHVPEVDHKIHYEKICPMEKCQRLQMDDFMRSLPSYMRASPFTHFEQTYEDYEACTQEQLEILKQRMEEKKKKERVVIDVLAEDPLSSWTPSIEGIGVQTSYDDIYLPPCTCPVVGSESSDMSQRVYNIVDLIPVKQELERINAECFFNDHIEFNRFKLIGQDEEDAAKNDDKDNFNKNRLQEIKKILKQHPSLCEIFQANIRC